MDSGPRFSSGFDTGEAVVLPAVASTAVREPDVVVTTHPDIDHAGGTEALVRAFPNVLLIGSDHASDVLSCQGFPAWRRDSVAFQLLPGDEFPDFSTANDRSCALLVDNGRHAVLLTGDTSDHAEMLLIRAARPEVLDRLKVVVVPRHGSRSSSSRAFVRRTRPRYAVVSAGRHNGYGHPHAQVVERWQQAGARVFSTAESGAIRWYSGSPSVLRTFRREALRYWRTTEST